jgi:CheY-like chemotaxis protein/anti-sigma regulatory factor (Ser/Thr protein kinase)
MGKILVVDDDPALHELIDAALTDDGHLMRHASDAERGLAMAAIEPLDLVITDFRMPKMDGVQFLEQLHRDHSHLKCIMMTGFGTPEAVIGALREKVCGFLTKPFNIADLRAAVNAALSTCVVSEIEIVSARPDWVELKIPCDLSAVPTLQKLLTQLKADLPDDTREAIAYAFREMLNNAIEHGGKLDPSKYVEVSYVRLKRAIIYRIKDPGEGFNLAQLEHAAVNNPRHDPFRHVMVRDEQGMRAGGFGILLTKQLVDEMMYNERGNELIFVKYL